MVRVRKWSNICLARDRNQPQKNGKCLGSQTGQWLEMAAASACPFQPLVTCCWGPKAREQLPCSSRHCINSSDVVWPLEGQELMSSLLSPLFHGEEHSSRMRSPVQGKLAWGGGS